MAVEVVNHLWPLGAVVSETDFDRREV